MNDYKHHCGAMGLNHGHLEGHSLVFGIVDALFMPEGGVTLAFLPQPMGIESMEGGDTGNGQQDCGCPYRRDTTIGDITTQSRAEWKQTQMHRKD